MPSKRPLDRLREIVIIKYTSNLDFSEYSTDQKTKDAVERCWQRISEASYKLGDYLDVLYPDVDWEGARGVGNILRHQYDEWSDLECWNSIREDLPKIHQAALAEIARLESAPRPPGV